MADYIIPEWLLEHQVPLLPPANKNKVRKSFVEKTIDTFSGALLDDFYAERIADSRGLLQGLHPGIKVITTLLLIFVAVSLRSWEALLLFNAWVIMLACMSAVPLLTFLKRVWLVVPVFTGIIIIPTIFNLIRPGTTLVLLHHFSGQHRFGPWVLPGDLTITSQGVHGAIVFILRVGACVSLSVLLTLTTRWAYLLRGFSMIRVPTLFISILEMTYRYIYVLLNNASDMFLARRSRTVGRTTTGEQQRFVGNALGAIWTRAMSLSDEVHAAMLSRGYTGEPKTLTKFQIQGLDWFWTAFTVLVSIIMIGGDRIIG